MNNNIETLRRILGHSDISTTTIYITLANIDVENEMKAFILPFPIKRAPNINNYVGILIYLPIFIFKIIIDIILKL